VGISVAREAEMIIGSILFSFISPNYYLTLDIDSSLEIIAFQTRKIFAVGSNYFYTGWLTSWSTTLNDEDIVLPDG